MAGLSDFWNAAAESMKTSGRLLNVQTARRWQRDPVGIEMRSASAYRRAIFHIAYLQSRIT
jgi:hypothetical protein